MKIFYFKEGKSMLSKKKKIFVLVGMVLLLVVTGYLNIVFNKTDSELTTSTTANFFTTSRADKVSARNYQLEIYDTIIQTSSDATEVANAKAEKNKIAAKIETESLLETMIAATGYDDVIVTNVDDGYNVFVKSVAGITVDEVAKILSILVEETGASPLNIKVTSVA